MSVSGAIISPSLVVIENVQFHADDVQNSDATMIGLFVFWVSRGIIAAAPDRIFLLYLSFTEYIVTRVYACTLSGGYIRGCNLYYCVYTCILVKDCTCSCYGDQCMP